MPAKTARKGPARRTTRKTGKAVDLVFAVTSVNGATAACARHGDTAFVQTIEGYYALAARLVRGTGGRIVKTLGDGFLVTFPMARVHEGIAMLRQLQAEGTSHWRTLDPECAVTVRVGSGPVIEGVFGPSGLRQYDVFGNALNRLFKLPPADFAISPELRQVLSAGHPGLADTMY